MRFEAAGACGAIASEAAAQHLLPLLEDEDHEVQEAAIAALGEIGGEVAKEALMELKESEVRRPGLNRRRSPGGRKLYARLPY